MGCQLRACRGTGIQVCGNRALHDEPTQQLRRQPFANSPLFYAKLVIEVPGRADDASNAGRRAMLGAPIFGSAHV